MSLNSRRWRHALLAAAWLAAPLAATAQVGDDEAPPRRYTVEMIVFLYTENVGTGGEIFVPESTTGDEFVLADPDIAEPEAIDDTTERVVARRIPLQLMAAEDFTMTDVWNHLRRLDVYRPVMRFGWTQPVFTEAETASRTLADFTQPAAGFSGDLKLYLGRFLHLVVDMKLAGDSEPRRLRFGADSAADGPLYYRINEDRIFKSGDLRYFDHPKFGILAKITRADDEASVVAGGQ